MAGAYIDGYCYSEGGSGATVAIDANQSLGTSLGTYVRPSSPQRFTDQLASWKAALDIALPAAAPWVCSYSATTRRVTLASAGLAWQPVLPGNVAAWIGMTQTIGAAKQTWVGISAPQARAELLGVTVEPAEDWTQTELAKYRHGRAAAIVWGNHQVHKVTLHANNDAVGAVQGGYLQSGRVRIYQSNSNLSAYAVSNVGGYVDGYVIACGPAIEQSPEWWSWDMLVGVPR